MTLYDGAPYFNLILTGPKGVGKTTIGRMIGSRLGVDVLDLETEILAREGQSADEIRALFGEARLKALEAAAVSELALRRQSILIVPGATMLEETNRSRLAESDAQPPETRASRNRVGADHDRHVASQRRGRGGHGDRAMARAHDRLEAC